MLGNDVALLQSLSGKLNNVEMVSNYVGQSKVMLLLLCA
jgi:hypothetical protein